ncbi:MAG: hypothetical protein AAFV85_26205 [Cyanobacteria bacterium J06634_6]
MSSHSSKSAEKKLVSFRLPGDLMNDLKHKAEEEGVSMTELVRRFSKEGLSNKPQLDDGSVLAQLKEEILFDLKQDLEKDLAAIKQQASKRNVAVVESSPTIAMSQPNSFTPDLTDNVHELANDVLRCKKDVVDLEHKMQNNIHRLSKQIQELTNSYSQLSYG